MKRWFLLLLIFALTVVVSGQTGITLHHCSVAVGTVSTPTASPDTGTYGTTQTETFAATNSTSIYYTNDGVTTPTCTGVGTLYTGGISTSVTTTYETIGCATGWSILAPQAERRHSSAGSIAG